MASEGLFSISVASVVEDVIKQHGTRLSDVDLASRKAEEAAARRYEAAAWLRRTVGVVGSKDLPEEPSEEEFRIGVRNGLIICNALNKVLPGSVPKVVEIPVDSVVLPDGAAISAYQYFENVRNFLVVLHDLGLPTFEASDLEQGGNGTRVVNSILALKSCTGRNGSSKYGGILKPTTSGKYFIRKNSEPFMNSLSRNQSIDKLQDGFSMEQNLSADFSIESTEMTTSHSLNMLVSAVLSNKKPEEVPLLVESMLSKVMQEFEHRIASQNEQVKTTLKNLAGGNKLFAEPNVSTELSSAFGAEKMEMEVNSANSKREDSSTTSSKARKSAISNKEDFHMSLINEEASKQRIMKQHLIFDRQQKEFQELKHAHHNIKAGIEFMKMQFSEEFSNLGKHLHILAHAASGYHKVLEENRKLYNQVQDLKGNIRVYCRVRPFLPGQSSSMSTIGHIDDGSITIITPSKYGKEGRRSFTFNKVFGSSATQGEVFSDTQPLIRSVLDGYNVCIFAYGQTGSGKTYTMSGPRELSEQNLGVNYRALNDLFYLSEQRRDTFCYEIAVQMIEIYNEQVRDLLVRDGLNKKLEIRNSSQKGLNVPDANMVPVSSTSDVIELMNLGHKNRAVCATAMNDRSSRSHCCLTVHVQGRDLTSGTNLRGCMHLVDLAGSERVDKSEVKGDRLKEAQHINKSLSALGDVISALAQKNSHVPYRNSKLTQLLQDSLGGQAKTLMFVHISPEVDAIGETLSTLKFAERVATVELGAARSNKESADVKEMKEQIASLKAALARKGGDVEVIRSTMSSPDIFRMNSYGSTSPAYSNQEDIVGCLINNRQPMEDVGNIEARSDLEQKQKNTNYNFQELLMATDSPPWPDNRPRSNPQNGGEKEMGSGDWVDKVIVNKHEAVVKDDDPLRVWDGECVQAPDFFYQRYIPDMRFHPDQHYNRIAPARNEFEIQRSRFDSATTDDSDDLEIATSDSSEADMLWQFKPSKIPSAINGGGSSIKKHQPKPTKSPDIRSPNRSHITSPSRKLTNGPGQTPNRTGRPGGGLDGKRSSSGKTGSGK